MVEFWPLYSWFKTFMLNVTKSLSLKNLSKNVVLILNNVPFHPVTICKISYKSNVSAFKYNTSLSTNKLRNVRMLKKIKNKKNTILNFWATFLKQWNRFYVKKLGVSDMFWISVAWDEIKPLEIVKIIA